MYSKQITSKLKGILEESVEILNDLRSCKDFVTDVGSLVVRCEQYGKEEFNKWCADMVDAVDNGDLGMEISGRLMEITTDGVLKVNYSEKLVTLLRDVRQLGIK